MLSIAHGTTGAFIASKIPHPLVAVPLIIASHFLEDYVPHWDVGQGIIKGNKSLKAAFWQELLFDLPLSIVLVYFFFQHGHPFNSYLWLGWFLGLLPDFLEFPRNFLKIEIPLFKAIDDFHYQHHRSMPKIIPGLLPQILLILALYFLR